MTLTIMATVCVVIGIAFLCFMADVVSQKNNKQAIVLFLLWPVFVVTVIGESILEYMD